MEKQDNMATKLRDTVEEVLAAAADICPNLSGLLCKWTSCWPCTWTPRPPMSPPPRSCSSQIGRSSAQYKLHQFITAPCQKKNPNWTAHTFLT